MLLSFTLTKISSISSTPHSKVKHLPSFQVFDVFSMSIFNVSGNLC